MALMDNIYSNIEKTGPKDATKGLLNQLRASTGKAQGGQGAVSGQMAKLQAAKVGEGLAEQKAEVGIAQRGIDQSVAATKEREALDVEAANLQEARLEENFDRVSKELEAKARSAVARNNTADTVFTLDALKAAGDLSTQKYTTELAQTGKLDQIKSSNSTRQAILMDNYSNVVAGANTREQALDAAQSLSHSEAHKRLTEDQGYAEQIANMISSGEEKIGKYEALSKMLSAGAQGGMSAYRDHQQEQKSQQQQQKAKEIDQVNVDERRMSERMFKTKYGESSNA